MEQLAKENLVFIFAQNQAIFNPEKYGDDTVSKYVMGSISKLDIY